MACKIFFSPQNDLFSPHLRGQGRGLRRQADQAQGYFPACIRSTCIFISSLQSELATANTRTPGTADVWRHQALSSQRVLRSCGSWRFQGRLSHRIINCPHFSIPVHCMNKLKLKMWTQKTISSGQPEEPCPCGDLHVTRCLLTAIQLVQSVRSG